MITTWFKKKKDVVYTYNGTKKLCTRIEKSSLTVISRKEETYTE